MIIYGIYGKSYHGILICNRFNLHSFHCCFTILQNDGANYRKYQVVIVIIVAKKTSLSIVWNVWILRIFYISRFHRKMRIYFFNFFKRIFHLGISWVEDGGICKCRESCFLGILRKNSVRFTKPTPASFFCLLSLTESLSLNIALYKREHITVISILVWITLPM